MVSRHALTLLSLFMLLAFAACKKDKNNNNNNTACNGKNLCFKMDGTLISEDATWSMINPTRLRILWQTNSGSYRNIEIDLFGTSATTYPVAANPGTGEAGFQYYEQNPARTVLGESGNIVLTSTANDKLSGNFTITAKDQNNNVVNITDGSFVDVPKQ